MRRKKKKEKKTTKKVRPERREEKRTFRYPPCAFLPPRRRSSGSSRTCKVMDGSGERGSHTVVQAGVITRISNPLSASSRPLSVATPFCRTLPPPRAVLPASYLTRLAQSDISPAESAPAGRQQARRGAVRRGSWFQVAPYVTSRCLPRPENRWGFSWGLGPGGAPRPSTTWPGKGRAGLLAFPLPLCAWLAVAFCGTMRVIRSRPGCACRSEVMTAMARSDGGT